MAADCDDEVVSNEIETLRQVGGLDFAPQILRWNLKERWYTEDFVIGRPFYSKPRIQTDISLKIFERRIVPCLEKMILWQQPTVIEIEEYVNQLTKTIAEFRTDVETLYGSKADRITKFVNANASCILKSATGKILLVFSHGDFSLVNILKTAKGIKVIDWEGAAKRNPLYDLYNYFLTESYYGRTTVEIVKEINEGINFIRARLFATSAETAALLNATADNYRRLYYLERIGMLLERDLNSKILEVILRSIHIFDAYEENLAKS
jgi:thiamine kinase-like enzyme